MNEGAVLNRGMLRGLARGSGGIRGLKVGESRGLVFSLVTVLSWTQAEW